MALSKIESGLIADNSVIGGTTATINGFTPQASNLQPFNRIINGAMTIDQRNAGASVTGIGNNAYITDRFSYHRAGGGVTAVFNSQQSTTAPTGYSNSAYLTATTGQTLGASGGRYMVMRHAVEGFNIADVLKNQGTVTLSFYAYVSNAGTYSLVFKNITQNSSYATTYSVTTANTWQFITVTFAINTSSGTWNYTTGTGLEIFWVLDADDDVCASSNNSWVSGAVYGASGQSHGKVTSGATFYITGVQLEAGSSASPFEHRQYGQELVLCQRYFQVYGGQPGGGPNFQGYGVGDMNSVYPFTTEMRVIPTSATSGNFQKSNSGDPVGVHTTTTATSIRVVVPTLGKFEAYPSGSSPIGKITFSGEL
jgi:hypothetical protein